VKAEWDLKKEKYNIKEHGFDFSLAEVVLNSDFVVEVYDRYENGEHRYHAFALLGHRVMLVVYADPDEDDNCVRVFGLRRATPVEKKRYERERKRTHKQ